jgi:peptide/nickel transport system permease protein
MGQIVWVVGAANDMDKRINMNTGQKLDMNSSGQAAKTKKRSFVVASVIRLVKEKPLGTVGAVITLLLLLVGIFADFISPYGMNQIHTGNLLTAPNEAFLLGTDNLGRDILSRIIHGARISVIVGLTASAIATILSTLIGILCGYIGGTFDLIVQRFVDAMMAMPGLVLLIVIISMIGPGLWQVIFVLGIRWGITGSRIIRSVVISIRENVYVEAANAIGCSTSQMLIRHILPNIMAPVIILFSTRVPAIILAEASLSFLGFGIPPPVPSWGGMLSGSGRTYMFLAPWMAVFPGLALSIVVYGVNMFGDALRDLLDPRLRGGVGRFGVKVKK